MIPTAPSGVSTMTTKTGMWAAFFGTNDAGVTEAPKELPVLDDDDQEGEKAEEAFECDYERDCSPLYRAIENAVEEVEFEPIVKFLDSGYWPGSFFADKISPTNQAKTWVTRFDPEDENKVKWSQLPLHLAIVCAAPPSIIGRLVKLYPQALRCTDDQHMLPLHLALRHNATDEVVAYLLMQFPDAVNAKGKSARTAVDCALRAKDKLRGKILEIFIEKTKGKKSSAIVREQNQLKAQISAKEDELNELKKDLESFAANFESMKALKHTVEQDLLHKIQELEKGKAEFEAELAHKLLACEQDWLKKIEEIQQIKIEQDKELAKANEEKDAENAHRLDKLKTQHLLETLELQKKLEAMERAHAETLASEKKYRIEEAALRAEIDTLHGRVAKSVSPDDWTSLKDEVKSLESFRLQHSRSQADTALTSLKDELEKTMENAAKTSSQSSVVKNELQSELKTIKKNVAQLGKDGSSAKTSAELNALRSEVDKLRGELKDRAEASKTLVAITGLKKTMEVELQNREGKTKAEVAALENAVQNSTMSALESKTNAELVTLKKELEELKKGLTSKELLKKTQEDLDELRSTLKTGLESADSKNKAELAEMKKSVEGLKKSLATTESSDEVIAVKKTLAELKEELKKKEAKSKILLEVASVKSTVEAELKKSEGQTQQELLQMKKAIKTLNEKELSKKDIDELAAVKGELTKLKVDLKSVEEAAKTKTELEELKKTIASEIKNSTGKTEKELAMMKEAVDAVDMEQKESKTLKKSLTEEIKQANAKTEKELLAMKKALDAMSVKKLESGNKDEWDAIRKEMEGLKADLKAKQQESISSEIDSIKKTVNALNLDAIEKKNETQFEQLRKEMDGMRADLKQKGDVMTKEIADIKKVASPKKKGLKKFFTRRFSKSNKDGTETITSMVSEGVPGKEDMNVTTIAPPSLAVKKSKSHSMDEGDAESSDSAEGSHASANDEAVLAGLNKTFSNGDDDAIVETVVTEESSVKQMPPKKPPSGNKFRKVQSMDPSTSPRSTGSAVSFTRTLSKTVIEANGDVELEKLDTDESDIVSPIAPDSPSVSVQ